MQIHSNSVNSNSNDSLASKKGNLYQWDWLVELRTILDPVFFTSSWSILTIAKRYPKQKHRVKLTEQKDHCFIIKPWQIQQLFKCHVSLTATKKGKRIPSPNNRRSLQYAGIPFTWYLHDRLEKKNFQWRITKHCALWVKWIRFDSILETTKGLQPIAAQMVIHTWDSVDGVIHI